MRFERRIGEGRLIRMEAALKELPKPMFGYCRSGARAGLLYCGRHPSVWAGAADSSAAEPRRVSDLEVTTGRGSNTHTRPRHGASWHPTTDSSMTAPSCDRVDVGAQARPKYDEGRRSVALKTIVLSLCFVAASAAYVWQYRQPTPDLSQADAELLGDPAARPSSAPHELAQPSPAVYRFPSGASDMSSSPAGFVKVAAAAKLAYVDGEFIGPAINAYYGVVQIQAIVQGGRVARLKVLQYPSDRQTSVAINRQALPMLRDEVIAAQSANVDIISGATLTSAAFIKSLGKALEQAH